MGFKNKIFQHYLEMVKAKLISVLIQLFYPYFQHTPCRYLYVNHFKNVCSYKISVFLTFSQSKVCKCALSPSQSYSFYQSDIERIDPRGRTPLHLSVTLGHLESARVLLRHGANANAENKGYWSGKIDSKIWIH